MRINYFSVSKSSFCILISFVMVFGFGTANGQNPFRTDQQKEIQFKSTHFEGSRDADYILDDGTAETATRLYLEGPPVVTTGDFMWINTFQALSGAEIINEVSIVFGYNIPDGSPTRIILYNDPNNDGDPSDAQYLNEIVVFSRDAWDIGENGKFYKFPFPPTLVDGTFFLAGLHQYQHDNQFPAAADISTPQNNSWVAGTTISGGFNVEDLSDPSHDLSVQDLITYGATNGNWLLRAHGSGDTPYICILDLDTYKNSGTSMADALDQLNVDYHYYPFWPTGYVDNYDAVFVCLGTYDKNHILTDAEGQELANFLDIGGRVFMEGGLTWAWDPYTPVHPYFNINGLHWGTDPGDTGPIAGVSGQFTDGMLYDYVGENRFMSLIEAISPAVNIYENQSPVYYNGVAYNEGSYKTIGTSFEFYGMEGTNAASSQMIAMAKYLEFFDISYPFYTITPDQFSAHMLPDKMQIDFMNLSYYQYFQTPYNIDIQYTSPPLTISNSWLSVTPQSGSINPYSNTTFDVQFNSAGLSPGVYEANIELELTVPGQVFNIPVYLIVEAPGDGEIMVEPTTLNIHPNADIISSPPPMPNQSDQEISFQSHAALNVSPGSTNDHADREYSEGIILVQFKKNVLVDQKKHSTNIESLNSLLKQLDTRDIHKLFDMNDLNHSLKESTGLSRVYKIQCPKNLDILHAIKLFENDPNVNYAEADGFGYPSYIPPDDLYSSQWGFNNTGQADEYGTLVDIGTPGADIDIQRAWDLETGNSSTVVAVVDAGIDPLHPEFAGRLLPGYDFVNMDDDPTPLPGDIHGTACAGIIAAAQDGVGVVGVAFGVNLLPVKVFEGTGGSPWSVISAGLVWAADQNADIISMSIGGTWYSRTLEIAVDYAYNLNSLVVVSSGNLNNDLTLQPSYPASFDNAINVGALSPCNERKSPTSCDGEDFWGSNYGGNLDFLCPGVRIPTTDNVGAAGKEPGDYMPYFNGTSAACPHAAGVAALVISHNANLSASAIATILRNSCTDIGTPGWDEESGYGRLSAYKAVLLAEGANSFKIHNQGTGPLTIHSIMDNKSWLSAVVPMPQSAVGGGMNSLSNGAGWEDVISFNDLKLYNNQNTESSAEAALNTNPPILLENPNGKNRTSGARAFGYTPYPNASSVPIGFVSFDLNDPTNVSSIGPALIAPEFVSGAAWANNIWYGTTYYGDSLISIDTTNGAYTKIAKMNAHSDAMAWDPTTNTMFIIEYSTGLFYSLDLVSGAATQIGTVGTGIAGICCSNEGTIYGINIATDTFGKIDKTNGSWYDIAPIPFDAQYAQDLTMKREDNLLYYAAYSSTTSAGELWTIDPGTGTFSFINTFDGGMEVAGFVIPSDMSWSIQPEESLLVDAFVHWEMLPPGPLRESGTITIQSDDTNEPTTLVTVNIMEDPIQSSEVLENDTVINGSNECNEAQNVIIAGGNGKTFIVENGGNTMLVAGRKVLLKPGFYAEFGSHFVGTISSNGIFCFAPVSPPIVTAQDQDDLFSIDQLDGKLSVYPNPTSRKVNIEIKNLNNGEPLNLMIYDFTGKEVFGLSQVSDRSFEVDLESYKPGIYVVRVIQGEFSENKKIVKH